VLEKVRSKVRHIRIGRYNVEGVILNGKECTL
jgi:hypothetical protein